MIYLYYSDSEEKDLVEGWAKYGTKMGFTTYTNSVVGYETVSTNCCGVLQSCTSTDTCSKGTYYDTICTTSNPGKLTVDYGTTITQGTTSTAYPWNYVKSNSSWDHVKSSYIVDPLQLAIEHRKVKRIIKFKPI